MVSQKRIRDILHKIAKEYDLPVPVIEEIFLSQFKAAKEICHEENNKEDNYNNIRFKYLGTLRYNKNMVNKVCKQDYIKRKELRKMKGQMKSLSEELPSS